MNCYQKQLSLLYIVSQVYITNIRQVIDELRFQQNL